MTELADNVVMRFVLNILLFPFYTLSNFRNIIAEFDPVSAVPCRENALCSSAPAPTSKNLHTREQYDEYPGLIQVIQQC